MSLTNDGNGDAMKMYDNSAICSLEAGDYYTLVDMGDGTFRGAELGSNTKFTKSQLANQMLRGRNPGGMEVSDQEAGRNYIKRQGL